MRYKTSDTVLAFGGGDSIKTAALFFRRVIPLTFSYVPDTLLPEEILSTAQKHFADLVILRDLILMAMYDLGHKDLIIEDEEEEAATKNLFTITLHFDSLFTRYRPVPGKEDAVNALLIKFLEDDQLIPEPGFFPYKKEYPGRLGERMVSFRDYIFNYEFCSRRHPVFGLNYLANATPSTCNGIVVAISNVPMVDVSRAEWAQIEELRRDERSISDFKRLQSFLHDNYLRRDEQYLEEDLESRITKFQQAAIRHGLYTKPGILGLIVASEFVLRGGLAGLIALTFGDLDAFKNLASPAAMAGGTVEFANRFLTIRAAGYDLSYRAEGHELAYLMRTQA